MNTNAQDLSTKNQLEEFLKNQGYSKVSLQKEKTGHLILKLKLNGVQGSFILDTGAGATIVEEKRTDKFKLSLTETDRKAAGAGGANLSLKESDDNELVIDSYRRDNFTLMLMNLDHVNGRLKELNIPEIDGVLGADILTPGRGIIAYSNLALYLVTEH
ncbi:MAG: clan AA aspartic protease [Maribacter sp.]|nr:clan AA aspartic protease [Maribacter sp.]